MFKCESAGKVFQQGEEGLFTDCETSNFMEVRFKLYLQLVLEAAPGPGLVTRRLARKVELLALAGAQQRSVHVFQISD